MTERKKTDEGPIVRQDPAVRQEVDDALWRWRAEAVRGQAPEIKHKWISDIRDRILSVGGIKASSYANIHRINRFAKFVTVDPTNYICTVFRVASLREKISANYAFLYTIEEKTFTKYTQPPRIPGIKPPAGPLIAHRYCLAPSLVSQDGEYRIRLLGHIQTYLLERNYPKIHADIEEYITEKIDNEELTLTYDNFFPHQGVEYLAEELDNAIVKNRMAMHYFIHFWLIEIGLLSVGMQENHINLKFNRLFFRDVKTDIAFYKRLCDKYTPQTIKEAIHLISNPIVQSPTPSGGFAPRAAGALAMGQKLRPLNVSEVQDPFNIKYPSWRELYISQIATNITVSFVCPSFPIMIGWYYIKNSRHGLFDNEQQEERMQFSERALTVVKKLRETQRLTYTTEGKTRKYINSVFDEISHAIDVPVEIAKSGLVMSNVTLGFVNENVGRTFFDIPTLYKSPSWRVGVGDILRDHEVLGKYIWDIAYACLCLNYNGIIHSDLHLNNATINTSSMAKIADIAKPIALYGIDEYWFKLPTRTAVGCIIDFSRATVLPATVRDYPNFRNSDDAFSEFIAEQNQRITNKMTSLFPTLMKGLESKFQAALTQNFDKIWRVYTAIDIYDFASKLYHRLHDVADKKSVDILKRMWRIAEHYLTSIMAKVIHTPDIQIELPVLQIIKECFQDRIINAEIPISESKEKIVDIWIPDSKVYNLQTYKLFPPWLRDEKLKMSDGSLRTSGYSEHLNSTRVAFEMYYKKVSMPMVDYIAQRHLEKYG